MVGRRTVSADPAAHPAAPVDVAATLATLADRTARVTRLAEQAGLGMSDAALGGDDAVTAPDGATLGAGGAALPPAPIQDLLALAVSLYAARARSGVAIPTAASQSITATEAMIATVGLLRAIDIDLFDYILWSGRA